MDFPITRRPYSQSNDIPPHTTPQDVQKKKKLANEKKQKMLLVPVVEVLLQLFFLRITHRLLQHHL
jgi:hypothetical protein